MLSRKILICDDDEGILEMMEMILEGIGTTVIAESNSLNVLALIETEKPDVVILDLWMPVLSGDQILKMIRDTPSGKDLPVIVMSASRDGESIAQEAGANDFIAKPFDIDNLVAVVDSQLALKN